MSDQVKNMFASISGKYDLMNDMLSFGIHRRWRTRTVKLTKAAPGNTVLDCACGTGDLAVEFKKKVGNGKVTAIDFVPEMIELARQKALLKKAEIDFKVADVMALPFEDDLYDISSISFGIRNVDDPRAGLKEMARVTKPGGKVAVLEFGQPKGLFSFLYKIYSKTVIPLAGKIFAGDKDAYKYLPETAAVFPAGDKFVKLMDSTGSFSEISTFAFSQGIAYLYIGIVK